MRQARPVEKKVDAAAFFASNGATFLAPAHLHSNVELNKRRKLLLDNMHEDAAPLEFDYKDSCPPGALQVQPRAAQPSACTPPLCILWAQPSAIERPASP